MRRWLCAISPALPSAEHGVSVFDASSLQKLNAQLETDSFCFLSLRKLMAVVMLSSLTSWFSLFCDGLRGRSRPSLQHLCLHSFPSFLQVWLHAHLPFSSLTGLSDVPSYFRFLDIRLLSLDLVRGRFVFVGF